MSAKQRTKKVVLEWKRGRRCDTQLARRMKWYSRCNRYCVVESRPKFDLPTRYFSMLVRGEGVLAIVGRHRTRKAAERSCVIHVNKKAAR
jgi:hypothetical protein